LYELRIGLQKPSQCGLTGTSCSPEILLLLNQVEPDDVHSTAWSTASTVNRLIFKVYGGDDGLKSTS
jgi:hypothetical protein